MTLLERLRCLPLAVKLAIPFAGAALLPIALASALEIQRVRNERLADAHERLASISRNLSLNLGEKLAQAQAVAVAVAHSEEARGLAHAGAAARPEATLRLRTIMRTLLATGSVTQDIALVGPDGAVCLSTDARDEGEPASAAFGDLTARSGAAEPLAARRLGERRLVLPIVAPVAGTGAYAVVLVSVEALEGGIRPQVGWPGSYGLLAGHGIGDPDAAGPTTASAGPFIEETYAVPGPGLALRLIYRVPTRTVYQPIDGVLSVMATVGGGAALSAALIGTLVAIRLGGRLRRLESAALHAARSKDLRDVEIEPGPLDEIGRLALAWKGTLGALGAARQELAGAAEQLQAYTRELEVRVEARTQELAGLNDELVRAAAEASALAHAAFELGREHVLDKVVASLSGELRTLLGVDFGIVFLASKDGTELVPAPPHAAEARRIGKSRIRLDEVDSSSARAFRERRAIVLSAADGARAPTAAGGEPPAGARPDTSVTIRRVASDLGARSAMAIPLVARDKPIGVLLTGFREPGRTPTKREVRLAETIAAEAGIALDRARLLGELAERERDLSELFDKATDLIFAYGPDGRFTRANQATLDALGYTLEEVLARRFEDVTDGGAESNAAEGDTPAPDRSRTLETVLLAKGGRKIPLELRMRVVRREGEVVEIQAFGRDLGQRHELEHERLEGARLKTAIELAGATAHNLNQPLTGITGFVDLLLASTTNKDDADMLRQIRKQAVRMADIVKKMKTLTKLETEAYVGSDRIVKLG